MTRNRTRKKGEDEDLELIRAINAGDEERFAELVEKYQEKIYNFSLRMLKDPEDAEDVVQDTFINVLRYLKDFRFETKFRNWLYKIARSVCIKKQRRSKFAPEKELSLDEYIPARGEEYPRQVPPWASAPLDALLNEELAGALGDAISDLPEKYRSVVILRDMEGFDTQETAQILNITTANVKVRLHRARMFVRDKLSDYFENGKPTEMP